MKGIEMNRRTDGFTIIEMLAVILIIAVIATVVGQKIFKGLGDANRKIAKAKMSIIEGALGNFYLHCGRYPTDEEGLDALIEAPSDLEEKWNGIYLKKSELRDPWDNPYEYMAEGERNLGSYDLISFGADGVEGGEEGTEDEDIYND